MIAGFTGRFFIFRTYLVAATLGILVLTFFAKQYSFFPFDLYITREIQLINVPIFESLMMALTRLGNYYQAIISLVLGFGLLWYFKKREFAIGLFISTVGAVSIGEILKFIVGRPRPDAGLIHQVETFMRNDSFPSGHVLFYIGFYGFLLFGAFTLIKNKLWRSLLSGVLLFMISLIGVSRIYIGSHWFSDTLASYLIGSVWLYFMVLIFKKIEVLSSDKVFL